MKEERYICDICGKTIATTTNCRPSYAFVCVDYKDERIGFYLRNYNSGDIIDLCDECKQAIVKTIQGRKQNGKYE